MTWAFDPDPAVPGKPLKICLTDMDLIPGQFVANFGVAQEAFEILEVGHPCFTIDTVPANAIAGFVTDLQGRVPDTPIPFA